VGLRKLKILPDAIPTNQGADQGPRKTSRTSDQHQGHDPCNPDMLPVAVASIIPEETNLEFGPLTQSTVATLAGVWAELRQRVVDGEEGRIRGLSPRELLMRRQLGACPDCKGRGLDVDRLSCSSCEGLGLRPDLLELRQGGFSLRAWLQELITTLKHKEKGLPRYLKVLRSESNSTSQRA
jgi:hypothetical protein